MSLVVGEEVRWVSEDSISWFTACGTMEAAADGLEGGTVTVVTQTVTTFWHTDTLANAAIREKNRRCIATNCSQLENAKRE